MNKLLAVWLIFLTALQVSQAEDEYKKNALSVSFGGYFPVSNFKDTRETLNTGLSYTGGLLYQRYITPSTGLGASVVFTQRDIEEEGRYALYDINQKIIFLNFLGVKRIMFESFELYARGGPSFVLNTLNYNGHGTLHTTFGFSAGGGGSYSLSESFFVGADAMYQYAKVKYDFATIPSVTKTQDLSGLNITLTFGIRY